MCPDSPDYTIPTSQTEKFTWATTFFPSSGSKALQKYKKIIIFAYLDDLKWDPRSSQDTTPAMKCILTGHSN